MISFLMLILGVLWVIGGFLLLFVCVVFLWVAGPVGVALFVGLLSFAWWIAGKDWGIARRIIPPNMPITPVHRKPGKPDRNDPATYAAPRKYKSTTSMDEPDFGPFDSYGLR